MIERNYFRIINGILSAYAEKFPHNNLICGFENKLFSTFGDKFPVIEQIKLFIIQSRHARKFVAG